MEPSPEEPSPTTTDDADVQVLPPDAIGDIPPPPVPAPPTIVGSGVAGIRGTEAGTFSRPGTRGAVPFRTAAYQPPRPPRFGPGVPLAGGGDVGGVGALSPEDAAELLRALAAGSTSSFGEVWPE
jgi:hypothetical protein